jgi:hypothetical protein
MEVSAIDGVLAPPHHGCKKVSQPVPLADIPPAVGQVTKLGGKRKKTATTPVNSPKYKDGPKPPAKAAVRSRPVQKQRKTAALKCV